jgi:sulfhydrogenase subunit alpha
MHTCNLDISINKLSKIEGHADLDITIRGGEVKDVNLRVAENRRFYLKAVEGKPAISVPQMVSRICGTCSVAHLTAAIEAVEKALEIRPSKQTVLLRKLMMYSLMIRDHALHLYFFALPDIFGIDSILDLPDDKKELIHEALHIKEAGNNLSNLIGGRSVHAPFEVVGGFTNVIDRSKIKPMIKELKSVRKNVVKLAEIFYNCPWRLERKTNYVGLVTPDFSFLEGEIHSSDGLSIQEGEYGEYLKKVVIPYSQASGYEFEGGEYMIGALPRLNLNKDALHNKTKKSMRKYLKIFPSENIYHNNLAQAIEIMHSIDHAVEILETVEFKKEPLKKPKKQEGEGVGVIEAPRGTLYYWFKIKGGKIKKADIVTPTAQNLINMQEDLRQLVSVVCHSNNPEEAWEKIIKKHAEKIIRAYDPCMSCASHFLSVNWKVDES